MRDSGQAENGLNQKESQYYSNGRRLYAMYCNSCHMGNGQGLGRLVSPLAKPDYIVVNRTILPRILNKGFMPSTVKDIEFNQPMPANPKLNNLEIAEIPTYAGNT